MQETDGSVSLGVEGKTLIALHVDAKKPVAPDHSGLYHVAIHFDERAEFARALKRLFTHSYPHSPTDHLVTETTYLWDQDGNGIELTFETPHRGEFIVLPDGMPAARTREGELHSAREPLDLNSLFAELDDGKRVDDPIAAGIRVGHVHLCVGDVDAATRFYRDLVGFHPLLNLPALQLADFDVDRQVPHTIAVNAWAGPGAPPAPAGAAGLRHYTIQLPTSTGLDELTARLDDHRWPFEHIAGGVRVLDRAANTIVVVVPAKAQ